MVQRACWERDWRQVSRRWPKGFYLWSCLNCGDCVDDVIAFNRAVPKQETEAQRNERIWQRVKDQVKVVAV